MEEIGKMNPEINKVGSNVTKRAIIIATCWLETKVEIIKPKLSAVIINNVINAANNHTLPSKGTPNKIIPSAKMRTPSKKANRI